MLPRFTFARSHFKHSPVRTRETHTGHNYQFVRSQMVACTLLEVATLTILSTTPSLSWKGHRMHTDVVSPSSLVTTGQRAVLDPIKMTLEMLDILEVIQNTKTFSCIEASKSWALSFKSYPKESRRPSWSRWKIQVWEENSKSWDVIFDITWISFSYHFYAPSNCF